MFRESTESLPRPNKSRRRSSVVEWINGLTDNNERRETFGRVDERSYRRTRNGSVASVEEPEPDEYEQHKADLIQKLKTEVKVIMDEAVTKKSIDINSTYVSSLCAAVETCLMDGLRRRLLGLFGCRTSLALLHSASKSCLEAEDVLARTLEISTSGSTHPLTWIREALHKRCLYEIVVYILGTKSMHRLYEPTALMVDPAKGGMVAALLLGPCAVTYKRMSANHDPTTAEDLVDRTGRTHSTTRHPLTIQRQSSSLMGSERGSISRDYVYSLHHNFKSSLLYGKNNVCLAGKEEATKGYLSLHKSCEGELSLKWTPNQLMHASSQPSSATFKENDQHWLWKQAMHVDMKDIIYLHLHQKDESVPAVLTLVDCEGVQSAPLQIPAGNHAVLFLASLESGLAPGARLDPPLWEVQGKGKILPRLRKRSTVVADSLVTDYVFRVDRSAGRAMEPQPLIEEEPSDQKCMSLPNSPYVNDTVDSIVNLQLDRACQSMKNQIMARAFFGWLSYCRHLRTIRKHLLYLVDHNSVNEETEDVVDEEFWQKCRTEKTAELEQELLRRVYWKGISGANTKELRRQIWPYLLGLFEWDEEPEPKTSVFTNKYREEVDEWRVLEAEVRRRDEEAFMAARQRKISPPVLRDASIVSDVFEDEKPPGEENGVSESKEQEPDNELKGEALISMFGSNLHRIDKDVERCDRNLIFFSNKENLESLRRVMCTYVRRNLEEGYIQGMCDILAPLLVIFEDEAMSLECFTILMSRLRDNFPQRSGMDQCISTLRSLIQVVDPQIFTMLTSSGDCTHLYFSYRWFLLDFKREMSYESTYRLWETIWSARRTITPYFALFFALAMITNYRDVIVTNNMDFTDMIKFFNEMAERHDCGRLLQAARGHVSALQALLIQLR